MRFDDSEELIEVEAHPCQAAQHVDHVSGQFFIISLLKHPEKNLHQVGVKHCVQIFVVHEEVSEREGQCPEALEGEEIGRGIIFGEEGVHGFDDEGILGEEEGRFGVY